MSIVGKRTHIYGRKISLMNHIIMGFQEKPFIKLRELNVQKTILNMPIKINMQKCNMKKKNK